MEIKPYQNEHRDQLLSVWERSVQATHHFLSPQDFEVIRDLVRGLDFHQFEVYCLVAGEQLLGFIGIADRKIEMLFLDPDSIGQGLGAKLIRFAIDERGADKVDVNEQNETAAAFYRKQGFQTFERTELDDQGKPYPLLRMRLAAQKER
jgi:putative acetyltransferase